MLNEEFAKHFSEELNKERFNNDEIVMRCTKYEDLI